MLRPVLGKAIVVAVCAAGVGCADGALPPRAPDDPASPSAKEAPFVAPDAGIIAPPASASLRSSAP